MIRVEACKVAVVSSGGPISHPARQERGQPRTDAYIATFMLTNSPTCGCERLAGRSNSERALPHAR